MKIDVGLLDRRIDDEILGDVPSVASTFFPFHSALKFTVSACFRYASTIYRFIFSSFFHIYFCYSILVFQLLQPLIIELRPHVEISLVQL